MDTSDAKALLWLVVSVIGGASIAYLFYYKSDFSPRTRQILFLLRAAVLSVLLYLLTGVLFRTLISQTQTPILQIVVDNSRSMRWVADSAQSTIQWQRFQQSITKWSKQAKVALQWHFIEKPKNLNMPFTAASSNLAHLVQSAVAPIQEAPVIGMILVSDGRYTIGPSPEHEPIPYRVFTLGLGSDTPLRDVRIRHIEHNAVVRQYAQTPIEFSLHHPGYAKDTIAVGLYQQGRLIEQKSIALSTHSRTRARFVIAPKQIGLQHYRLRAQPPIGESNTENNSASLFIQVVAQKRRVLVLAEAPHPDIKAIGSALTQDQAHEVVMRYPNPQAPAFDPKARYDVGILYGGYAPHPYLRPYYDQLASQRTPLWIWLTPESDPQALKTLSSFGEWEIHRNGRQAIQGTGYLREDFRLFSLPDESLAEEVLYPPLRIPDLSIRVPEPVQVMLYQQVGQAPTTQPLWLFAQPKVALSLGQGYFRQRMAEYAQLKHTRRFDKRITQSIQYLSSTALQAQFQLRPQDLPAPADQAIRFSVQHYNALYEPLYHLPARLRLKGVSDSTFDKSYVLAPDRAQRASIPPLPAGHYTYTASTQIANRTYRAKGQLFVQAQDPEKAHLSADLPLLRRIAQQSKGRFFPLAQHQALYPILNSLPRQPKRHQSQHLQPLIQFQWLLPILLALLAAEWVIRRRAGSF